MTTSSEQAPVYGGQFQPSERNNPRTIVAQWVPQRARVLAAISGYRVVEGQVVFKPRFARFWRTFNGFQIVLNLAPKDANGA